VDFIRNVQPASQQPTFEPPIQVCQRWSPTLKTLNPIGNLPPFNNRLKRTPGPQYSAASSAAISRRRSSARSASTSTPTRTPALTTSTSTGTRWRASRPSSSFRARDATPARPRHARHRRGRAPAAQRGAPFVQRQPLWPSRVGRHVCVPAVGRAPARLRSGVGPQQFVHAHGGS